MALSRPSKDTSPNRGFGRQADGSWHWGTDWGWGNGPQVFAMLPGVVTEVRKLADYGNIIRIDHGLDANGVHVETRYCHLSTAGNVKVGQWVPLGHQLALMGNTGSLTDQIHLHSELYLDSKRQDETAYTFASPAPPTQEDTFMKIQPYAAPGITHLLLTDNGAYALGSQAEADNCAVAIGNAPTKATLDFLLGKLYGPRYSVTGPIASILAAGASSSALTPAQDAALMGLPAAVADIPTNAETLSLHTAQTGDINGNTNAKFAGLTLSTP